MLTFRRLCQEIEPWSNHNFGRHKPTSQPAMGLLEEVGELAHAELKYRQGIRAGCGMSEPEFQAELADAVADVTVFLADFWRLCNQGQDEDLGNWESDSFGAIQVEAAHTMVAATLWRRVARLAAGVGKMVEDHAEDPSAPVQPLRVYNILVSLAQLCQHTGISFGNAVQETWNDVKTRDWVKYPESGHPPARPGGDPSDGMAGQPVLPAEASLG